jgi:hypothetical protein
VHLIGFYLPLYLLKARDKFPSQGTALALVISIGVFWRLHWFVIQHNVVETLV